MASASSNNTAAPEQQEGNSIATEDDDDDSIDLEATSLSKPDITRPKSDFEMINLDADEEDEDDGSDGYHTDERRKKRYRKKKHKKEQLSDSSSEDEMNSKIIPDEINPSELTWPLWVWYYIIAVSSGALKVAEYLGEKLAHFFGITSPKYQYVIDEFYRRKEQEKEENERVQREKDYVEKKAAERLAQLEGGDGSEKLIMPEDDADAGMPQTNSGAAQNS